jgi:DNA mismatch repair protein MutS2
MGRSAEELLEFHRLREILAGYATCALGRRAVEKFEPRQDRRALEEEFVLIRESGAYLRTGAELGFGGLPDPAEWQGHLGMPVAVLEPEELLDAALLMDAATSVKATFHNQAAKWPKLAAVAESLGDFQPLAKAIRHAILPDGEISDDASPELRRIRGAIAQGRDRIQRSLQQILQMRGREAGEDYITLRNDRFVIPVKSGEKRAVPGVVHGASATGQTLFIEPLESIELNNRQVKLKEEEIAEIHRILAELTDRLRMHRKPLDAAAVRIGELDGIFARGRFAQAYDAVMPEFTEDGMMRLTSARNPVLEQALRAHGRRVVPVTMALGGVETVMVISGPNTGGKTVTLKTAGLAALAAQSAIPVAAERAEMPLFDRVLADIGDEQSITADLSTFSAHILNVKSMLETATERTMVLVDEPGAGTAPEEGSALAMALLEEFRMRKCLTIATTHHDRLKSYASSTPGVLNAAVEFDDVNLRPTYRLLVGVPGTSSGLEIARRLGLAEQVVERARAELSPDVRESQKLIVWLHKTRDEVEQMQQRAQEELTQLEAERRTLQKEWVERQRRRLQEMEARFQDAIRQLEAEVERLTQEVRDRRDAAAIDKHTQKLFRGAAAEARAEADAATLELLSASQQDLGDEARAVPQPVAPATLEIGMRVQVRGMKQAVIFRRHDGRQAEVEAGPLRMKVLVSDIMGLETAPQKKAAEPARRGMTVTAKPSVSEEIEEINVIGCTVEEAVDRVDKFLDTAVLENKAQVRIIHGYGTGALRRGLAKFLNEHPLVGSIHAEEREHGGEAVTVVKLKG